MKTLHPFLSIAGISFIGRTPDVPDINILEFFAPASTRVDALEVGRDMSQSGMRRANKVTFLESSDPFFPHPECRAEGDGTVAFTSKLSIYSCPFTYRARGPSPLYIKFLRDTVRNCTFIAFARCSLLSVLLFICKGVLFLSYKAT